MSVRDWLGDHGLTVTLCVVTVIGISVPIALGYPAVAVILAAVGISWPLWPRLPHWVQLLAVFVATWTGLEVGGIEVAMLVMGAAAVGLLASKLMPLRVMLASYLAGVGIVLVGVIGAWSHGRDLGGGTLAQIFFAWCVVPLVVASVAWRWPRHTAAAFVLGVSVGCLLAIGQVLHITDLSARLVERQSFTNSGRTLGLSGHQNQLGLAGAMAIPLALALARQHRRWYLVAGVLVAGVLASGSRAGMITSAASVVILMVFERRLSLPRLARYAMVSALVVAGLAALGFNIGIERFTDAELVQRSDALRSEITQQAVDDFWESPIVGMGFSPEGRIDRAHNLYLEMGRSAGLAGLLVVGAYLVWIIRFGWRASRFDELIAGAEASFASWLFAAFFHNGLFHPFLLVPAGMVIGMTVRRSDAARTSRATTPARAGR